MSQQQKQIPQQDNIYKDTFRPENITLSQQDNTENGEQIPRVYIEDPSDSLKKELLKKLGKYLLITNYKYKNKDEEVGTHFPYVNYIKIEPKPGYCLKRKYSERTRPRIPYTVKYFVQTEDGLTTIAIFTTNTDFFDKVIMKQVQQKGGAGGGVDTGSTTSTSLPRQTKLSKIPSLLESSDGNQHLFIPILLLEMIQNIPEVKLNHIMTNIRPHIDKILSFMIPVIPIDKLIKLMSDLSPQFPQLLTILDPNKYQSVGHVMRILKDTVRNQDLPQTIFYMCYSKREQKWYLLCCVINQTGQFEVVAKELGTSTQLSPFFRLFQPQQQQQQQQPQLKQQQSQKLKDVIKRFTDYLNTSALGSHFTYEQEKQEKGNISKTWTIFRGQGNKTKCLEIKTLLTNTLHLSDEDMDFVVLTPNGGNAMSITFLWNKVMEKPPTERTKIITALTTLVQGKQRKQQHPTQGGGGGGR